MFEGRNNSYDPFAPKHYPIYGGKVNVYASVFDYYNPLKEVNRNVLRRYVYKALDAKGMLSGKRVARSEFLLPEDPGPEKEYTVQIYGEDLDHRYGNRVMFANPQEVYALMSFLEKEVGEERMEILKRSLAPGPDDVEKVGIEWLKKWRAGEPLPLAVAAQ